MNQKNSKLKYRFFKITDLALYILLAIIAVLAFVFIPKIYGGKGNYLYIYSAGELVKVMPLEENDVFTVYYENHYNIVVVKNGSAYVEKSDCPDQICVNSGKINRNGESIICLPFKMKMEVKSIKPPGGVI